MKNAGELAKALRTMVTEAHTSGCTECSIHREAADLLDRLANAPVYVLKVPGSNIEHEYIRVSDLEGE